MPQPLSQEQLDARYNLVEKLLKLFRFERIVHLTLTAVSFIMLLVSIWLYVRTGTFNATELTLIFGSTGTVAFTGGNLLRMWNQAIKIIIEGKL